MDNSMLYKLPIDPFLLIVGFSALTLVLLVTVMICIVKMNKLYRRYDRFMRGKDAETLEDTIRELMEQVSQLYARDQANKDTMKYLSKQVKSSFQKFGFVKYNAFKGMGGNLSFVIAMLDSNNSGFVLDAVHSREGCYLYLKEVDKGATEVLLGSEEQEALEQALGYVKRPTILEKGAKEEKWQRTAGSGEQSIETPNQARMDSERMKELRKKYREPEEPYTKLEDTEYDTDEEDKADSELWAADDDSYDDEVKGEL